MTVLDLLSHLTRFSFLALSVVTLLSYVKHRDKIRRDIFLVFLSLTLSLWLQLFTAVTGIEFPARPIIGQIALVAQPFLMIRLVQQFQSVPPFLYKAAATGTVVIWIALILIGTAQSPVVTLLAVALFLIFDGYAVTAFIHGAFSSAGVVRRRLQFAAAGSGFLLLVLSLAGINVIAPLAQEFTLPLIQLGSVCSAVAYYLGFAPPRWLRLAWQHAELGQYLQAAHVTGIRTIEGMLDQLNTAVKRVIGTNVVAVKVALWDKTDHKLILHTSLRPSPVLITSEWDGTLQSAWQQQRPVAYELSTLDEQGRRRMSALNSETLLIVPITTYTEALGLLLVFLQHGSLFVDDDLRLLTIFAQQVAILLQNHAMLEELYRHAARLEQTVKERTADLQRSNEELKMFAYIASHDLQEPLRTISSYLQLIASRYADKLDTEGVEFINFAVDGAARMKELIQDVLVYSRVQTQPQNFTLTNVQTVLDEVFKLLEVPIAEAEATITNDPMPEIMADRRLLVQLFQNLLSNAVKYRDERKPEIHIGARREDDDWLFSVRDNGIGIESHHLEQIFIVFRRLHSRSKYEGTGIGLAVCKKAVELHGGRIWLESEFGSGSTFYFTIPVQPVLQPPEALAEPAD